MGMFNSTKHELNLHATSPRTFHQTLGQFLTKLKIIFADKKNNENNKTV